jgi:hypothetical protein
MLGQWNFGLIGEVGNMGADSGVWRRLARVMGRDIRGGPRGR